MIQISFKINDTINSPHQSSRGKHYPQLIVCHICDGTYEGTKGWFSVAQSQTSSHFVVAQDGRICQCVPLDKMAWCNGTDSTPGSSRYYNKSTVPLVKKNGGNANQYSISIECEGYWKVTKGALSDKQLDAVAWLIGHINSQISKAIPLDREHIVGHYEITPATRANCPGDAFPWDALIAKLRNKSEPKAIYRVQIGAFKEKSNADNYLKQTVFPNGVEAFVTECDDGCYRAQIGAFAQRENADKFAKTIKASGIDCFVITGTK